MVIDATTAADPALVLTGERTLPGIADENYWFRRHEAAYRALLPWVTGAVVLEAGCGEGYGADLLAAAASRVVALDYDEQTARHAARAYARVTVGRADLQRLPVADGVVEVVASLQVFEHLHDQAGFLRECARVLRPAGTLLLTTPNRVTFSPFSRPGDHPLNPFHTRELDPAELAELLNRDFDVCRLYGLRHGRRLRRLERRQGDLVAGQLGGPPASWSPQLRHAVHGVRAGDFTLSPQRLGDCLDLVAVAVRRGAPR